MKSIETIKTIAKNNAEETGLLALGLSGLIALGSLAYVMKEEMVKDTIVDKLHTPNGLIIKIEECKTIATIGGGYPICKIFEEEVKQQTYSLYAVGDKITDAEMDEIQEEL